jgi:hypothetical protein
LGPWCSLDRRAMENIAASQDLAGRLFLTACGGHHGRQARLAGIIQALHVGVTTLLPLVALVSSRAERPPSVVAETAARGL